MFRANVPSTGRSLRDGTPIYPCEGLEARFSHRPQRESKPGASLRHASSTTVFRDVCHIYVFKKESGLEGKNNFAIWQFCFR